MPKPSIVSSPIFIPRLMNQDRSATEIGKLPGVLMNAHIVAYYKNVATKARNASKLFIIDPMTNYFLYDSYTEKPTFQKIPYAPAKPLEMSQLFSDEKFRINNIVEPSIKFQIDKNADIIIAPYFFSDDESGDKFRLNHTLLPDSIKYIQRQKIENPLFAMINIGSSALKNLRMLNRIIDRYKDHHEELTGYCVMIDNLNDIKADEDSLKGLAWLVFQLSHNNNDVFVFSIGAFGEVLSAIGIKGFSSGLAWLETFSEETLKQRLKFTPRKKKVNKTYVPELYDYINDEIVKLINYKCSCASCEGKIPLDYTSKKLHFLHRRMSAIKKMSNLNRNERIGLMKARLEEALDLAEGLYAQYAIPLQTLHLTKWIRILDSAKRWKHSEVLEPTMSNLDQLINEVRSK